MALYPGLGTQSLEDAFFIEQDKKLREQMAAMKVMKESRENLHAVSGITNTMILDKLINLNIPPHIVASLSMIPLVEVAWADGVVSEKERTAVLSTIASDTPIDRELLENWLTRKPEPHLLDAWIHYVQGICEQCTPEERESLKHSLLDQCKTVAQSDGGILGIGTVSKEESSILKKLESAFN